MPEVVEVKLTSEELHAAMAGRYITSIKLGERAKHRGMDKIKMGTLINQVYSKGKKIIFELIYKGQYSYLCSSLLMEGHWGWDNSLPHIQLSIGYGRKANERIYVTENRIYFDDTRYFGSNVVYPNTDFLSAIGPDYLQDKIDPNLYYQVASKVRSQISTFLLEQKYFSGIGNYLKSEILYRSKIHPARITKELSKTELLRILRIAIETINESYQAGGLTIKSFRTPSGIDGRFQCLVYGQSYDPNGYPVIKETFKDGRTTWYVEEIQR